MCCSVGLSVPTLIPPWHRVRSVAMRRASGGLGWLWLTREESIWILPSAALLVATSAVIAWKQKTLRWPAIISAPAVAALVAAVPIFSVCSLNARYYGWFGTVEFRAPEFIAAYAALQRVRPRIVLERVALPRDARLPIRIDQVVVRRELVVERFRGGHRRMGSGSAAGPER